MLDLNDLRLFVHIVDNGGIVRAARLMVLLSELTPAPRGRICAERLDEIGGRPDPSR